MAKLLEYEETWFAFTDGKKTNQTEKEKEDDINLRLIGNSINKMRGQIRPKW